jgi:hypothetical protein
LAFLNTGKIRTEGSKIAALFGLMVLGTLANWFWKLGWAFLQDPEDGISFGSPLEIGVRVVLAFIAAGLAFQPNMSPRQRQAIPTSLPPVSAIK